MRKVCVWELVRTYESFGFLSLNFFRQSEEFKASVSVFVEVIFLLFKFSTNCSRWPLSPVNIFSSIFLKKFEKCLCTAMFAYWYWSRKLTTVQQSGQNHQSSVRIKNSIRMSRAIAKMIPLDCDRHIITLSTLFKLVFSHIPIQNTFYTKISKNTILSCPHILTQATVVMVTELEMKLRPSFILT